MAVSSLTASVASLQSNMVMSPVNVSAGSLPDCWGLYAAIPLAVVCSGEALFLRSRSNVRRRGHVKSANRIAAGLGNLSFPFNHKDVAERGRISCVSHKPQLLHTRRLCNTQIVRAGTGGQTQTVKQQGSTIMKTPSKNGQDMSAKLDDGGIGFPPLNGDGWGGGGGGGGFRGSGGFYLFLVLLILDYLKDKNPWQTSDKGSWRDAVVEDDTLDGDADTF